MLDGAETDYRSRAVWIHACWKNVWLNSILINYLHKRRIGKRKSRLKIDSINNVPSLRTLQFASSHGDFWMGILRKDSFVGFKVSFIQTWNNTIHYLYLFYGFIRVNLQTRRSVAGGNSMLRCETIVAQFVPLSWSIRAKQDMLHHPEVNDETFCFRDCSLLPWRWFDFQFFFLLHKL